MKDYRLLDGPSIPINLELVDAIGLNETFLLQQIHYWCCKHAEKGENFKDGYYWVYNSAEKWTEALPWNSPTTTKKAIKSLEEKGLVVTGKFSYGHYNRTKWYRVDYDKVAELTSSFQHANMSVTPTKITGCLDRNCPNNQTEAVRTKTYNKTKNTQVNGDLPLTVNPTTVESPLKENIEFGNSNDDCEIDLNAFIDWYYFEHARTFGKNHPVLGADQRLSVIDHLTTFLSDPDYAGIDMDFLQDMACDFFDRVQSSDWHIFHFVNPEILKYRYYSVYNRG